MSHNFKYVIGIDEAGRGPLAGPVAVGVVLVTQDFDWTLIAGVGDSKQLSPEKRAALFRRAQTLKREGKLDFAVAMVSAKIIDKIGIVPAVTRAMARALKMATNPRKGLGNFPRPFLGFDRVVVKLDGGLRAPKEYLNQETIIKGDQKELSIGLASVVAKVTRDRYMERVGKRPEYSVYDLHVHEGYGTKAHRLAIKMHGCTDLHRRSYCKNIWQA